MEETEDTHSLADKRDERSATIPMMPFASETGKSNQVTTRTHVRLNRPRWEDHTRSLSFSKSRTPYWLSRLRRYHCLTELLSCVLAVVALAAIFITLAMHEDQPLPQWPKSISINSLVAVFKAILKAALLMPVAEDT